MQRVSNSLSRKNLFLAGVMALSLSGAINAIACEHEGCSADQKAAECKDCQKGAKNAKSGGKKEECKCKGCKDGTCEHHKGHKHEEPKKAE